MRGIRLAPTAPSDSGESLDSLREFSRLYVLLQLTVRGSEYFQKNPCRILSPIAYVKRKTIILITLCIAIASAIAHRRHRQSDRQISSTDSKEQYGVIVHQSSATEYATTSDLTLATLSKCSSLSLLLNAFASTKLQFAFDYDANYALGFISYSAAPKWPTLDALPWPGPTSDDGISYDFSSAETPKFKFISKISLLDHAQTFDIDSLDCSGVPDSCTQADLHYFDRDKVNVPKSVGYIDTASHQSGPRNGPAVLVAPTGSGKTEAAMLLWAASQADNGSLHGRFYLMPPYHASMNTIYAAVSAVNAQAVTIRATLLYHGSYTDALYFTADLLSFNQLEHSDQGKSLYVTMRAPRFLLQLTSPADNPVTFPRSLGMGKPDQGSPLDNMLFARQLRAHPYWIAFAILPLALFLLVPRPQILSANVTPEVIVVSTGSIITVEAHVQRHWYIWPLLRSALIQRHRPVRPVPQTEVIGNTTVSYLGWLHYAGKDDKSNAIYRGTYEITEFRSHTLEIQIRSLFGTPLAPIYQPSSPFDIRGRIPPMRVAVSTRPATLPADPGKANDATLEGIDADHDGLRDDLQREIFFAYPHSERVRTALYDSWKSQEKRLTDGKRRDANSVNQDTQTSLKALGCAEAFTNDDLGPLTDTLDNLLVIGNPDRIQDDLTANALLQPLTWTPAMPLTSNCDFDWAALPD